MPAPLPDLRSPDLRSPDLRSPGLTAAAVCQALGLAPHPEGGWYREIWRDTAAPGQRGAGTAIYYLLAAGERSHWHRVDAAEAWHWYAGGLLTLSLSPDGLARQDVTVGPDLAAGAAPFAVVPAGHWQAACPAAGADWVLVGCTVSPAFEFAGFEMAPPGWEPGLPTGRIAGDRTP